MIDDSIKNNFDKLHWHETGVKNALKSLQ